MSETLLSADYAERAKANNFASPQEIVEAMKQPGTIVLDVRTDEEIAEARFHDMAENVGWAKTGCTRTECPALEGGDAARFIPTKETTVVVHCASGVRANRAKMTLEKQGYQNILNGGGLNDMLIYPQLFHP